MRKTFLVLGLTMVQGVAFAADNFWNYDEIVRELSLSERTSAAAARQDFTQAPVRIHGSVGFVAGRLNLAPPTGLSRSQSLQGAEVVLGIDLFSEQWIAEGAVRSFESEPYTSTNLSLREFDLRIVHQTPILNRIDIRWGAGMAARYLNFSQALPQLRSEYSTPASLFILGLRGEVNQVIALSLDASLRSRMVDDTIDKGSFDAALRLTGSF